MRAVSAQCFFQSVPSATNDQFCFPVNVAQAIYFQHGLAFGKYGSIRSKYWSYDIHFDFNLSSDPIKRINVVDMFINFSLSFLKKKNCALLKVFLP